MATGPQGSILVEQSRQPGPRDDLKRDVSRLGMLWASGGSVIGAGWLFGVLLSLPVAGPAALIAWVIATAVIVVLGLVYAELGGVLPVSGGGGLFPQYAFGSLAGASFGWFGYLQAAAHAPIEVIAAIQYMSTTSGGGRAVQRDGRPPHRPRDRGRRRPAGRLCDHQPHRDPMGGAGEQRAHHGQGSRAPARRHHAHGDPVPRRQLHRGRRVLPGQRAHREGADDRDRERRHHLRLHRL